MMEFLSILMVIIAFAFAIFIIGFIMAEPSKPLEVEEEEPRDDQADVPRGTSEKSGIQELSQGNSNQSGQLKIPKLLEKPSKEQLVVLKEELGIVKGSLQFKDGSIYLVTSNKDSKKHEWRRLGRTDGKTVLIPLTKRSESSA